MIDGTIHMTINSADVYNNSLIQGYLYRINISE